MPYLHTRAFEYAIPEDRHKTIVRDGEAFERMVRRLEGERVLGVDYETSGLAYYKHARACGIALGALGDNGVVDAYYVPYRHRSGRQLDFELVRPALRRLLGAHDVLKVAHFIKFDDHIGRRDGLYIVGRRYCTATAARIYNENDLATLKHRAVTDLGEKDAATWEKHIRYHVVKLSKAYGLGLEAYRARFGYSEINIDVCGVYACFDIDYCLRLYAKYEHGNDALSAKYARVTANEMRLTEVLCDMEEQGLPVDVDYLESLRDSLSKQLGALEHKVWEAFPQARKFSLGNDNQLRLFLLNELHLPLFERTKSGEQLAVTRNVLEHFAEDTPELMTISEWRDAQKIATTYTSSILDKLDAQDVLHCEFNQMGANTGRLSSSQPNMQNIVSDSDRRAEKHSGKSLADGGVDPWSVKRAFTIPKGYARVYLDYSQIELRVLTHYCKDPLLVESYVNDEDVHTRTSMEVFGTSDPSKRRISKCFHPDTQVLTRTGWVALRDLKYGQEVVQAHPERDGQVSMSWTLPQLTCRPSPTGSLLHLRNEGIDLRVTSDHRMLGWRASGRWDVVEAEEFNGMRYFANAGTLEHDDRCKAAHRWIDERFARLLIAVQADGHYVKGTTVSFGFSKKRKIGRLVELLGDWPHLVRQESGVTRITFSGALGKRVKELMPGKKLPWTLLGCSLPVRQAMLDEAAHWDGHVRSNWRAYRYSNTCEQSLGVLQAIAAVSGRKSRLAVGRHATDKWAACYHLTVRDRATSRGGMIDKASIDHPGDVMCLSVPSSFVLVRDGGVPVITGQCINFGLVYGLSARGLSRHIKVSEAEAEQYMRAYFARYKGVPAFRDLFWRTIRRRGGTFHNLWGRPRRVPEISSRDNFERGRAERRSFGSLIQGTAAELTKESLVRMHDWLRVKAPEAHLVSTIHDEIQFDVPIDMLAKVVPAMQHLMVDYPEFAPIPIRVEGKISNRNWAETIKLPLQL